MDQLLEFNMKFQVKQTNLWDPLYKKDKNKTVYLANLVLKLFKLIWTIY